MSEFHKGYLMGLFVGLFIGIAVTLALININSTPQ
jgi:hypothetical protein